MSSRTIAHYFSGMPNHSENGLSPPLSDLESKLLHIVASRWPTSSLEIAEFLGHECVSREQKRLLSSRIVYHVKKLVEKKHIVGKRVGHALIVWPYDVETLRVMHEMVALSPHLRRANEENSSSVKHHSSTLPANSYSSSLLPAKKSIWKEDV